MHIKILWVTTKQIEKECRISKPVEGKKKKLQSIQKKAEEGDRKHKMNDRDVLYTGKD